MQGLYARHDESYTQRKTGVFSIVEDDRNSCIVYLKYTYTQRKAGYGMDI